MMRSVHNAVVLEQRVDGAGAGPEEECLLAVEHLARLLDLGQLHGDVALRQVVGGLPHALGDHLLRVRLALRGRLNH